MEAEQHLSSLVFLKAFWWITNKSQKNQKRNQNMHRNEWKWKHNNPKPVGYCKSSAKGKVHSNTGLPQEMRKSQINNLTLHLKQLEKEEMKKPSVSRRREIFKMRPEINAKETKETIAKINKGKSWFFERINKIDKPLARHIKKQREKNQINKIRNENGEITTDNTEIQRLIKDY